MAEKESILSNPLIQGLLGLGIGVGCGLLANQAYHNCDEADRRKWDKERIMHHGELGAITAATGIAAKSPFIAGLGAGWVITDLQDAHQWFATRRTL